MRNCNTMAWPETNLIKGAKVFPQRDLTLSSAVDVVEYYFRQAATRRGTKIIYANHSRGGGSPDPCHRQTPGLGFCIGGS